MKYIRYVLPMMVLSLIMIFGITETVNDFKLESITGRAISGEFKIEELKEAHSPVIGVLLRTEDNKMTNDVLDSLTEKEGDFLLLDRTTIPAGIGDEYLYVEWNRKLILLSLYMKKEGESTSFEIWAPGNTKIASGELTDEYKWYHFRVSSVKMSSDSYALFNYGGGEG
ncbi:hypothetical protein H8D36_07190, partial [archaeon]|nr:hypothetical protein [archaeon]